MLDQEDDATGIALGVVFGLLTLVIALVIGIGVHQQGKWARASAAPAAATNFVLAGSDVEFVDVEESGALVAKVYFELGQKELSPTASAALVPVYEALRAQPGKRALVSGFHDETGGAAINAEVAAARALSVRAALLNAGIDPVRILLRRPAVALGGDDAAQARRVEVRIQ